ncbi:hypothetical protein EDM55_03600 [Brevibacillus centrosporus]|nr:hypothetical protein EDM55_03600 [Brevibacillus centrosporus]
MPVFCFIEKDLISSKERVPKNEGILIQYKCGKGYAKKPRTAKFSNFLILFILYRGIRLYNTNDLQDNSMK